MYAVTSSMKGSIGRRFADVVCKKVGVNKVAKYSSQVVVSYNNALDMKLGDDLNKIRDRTPNLPFQASSIFSVNSRRNLNPPTRNFSTAAASFVGDNTSATTTAVVPVDDSGSGCVARIGEGEKGTKIETNVSVKINLNGSGIADCNCGIPLLDEMLHQFASYGLFDVHVKATGDIDVDQRRTNEDVAIAIGTALQQAVGDKKDNIKRFGSFFATHHGVLIHAALDLSGHPYLDFDDYYFDTDWVGTYDTELVEHFFESLVNTSGMTLHLQKISGKNSHHVIEATFKAFAVALRQATEYDPRRRPLLLEHSQLQND